MAKGTHRTTGRLPSLPIHLGSGVGIAKEMATLLGRGQRGEERAGKRSEGQGAPGGGEDHATWKSQKRGDTGSPLC